jgi:hypothetical protein
MPGEVNDWLPNTGKWQDRTRATGTKNQQDTSTFESCWARVVLGAPTFAHECRRRLSAVALAKADLS